MSEVFQKSGYNNRYIARELGRYHSSIDREIKRNSTDDKYHAEVDTSLYKKNRATSKPKGKWTDTLAKKIEEKLIATW